MRNNQPQCLKCKLYTKSANCFVQLGEGKWNNPCKSPKSDCLRSNWYNRRISCNRQSSFKCCSYRLQHYANIKWDNNSFRCYNGSDPSCFYKPKSDCWCYKYPEYLYSYFDCSITNRNLHLWIH